MILPFALVFGVFLSGSALGAVVVGTIAALLGLVLLTLGPVPALAALGNALTGSRAGLYGSFLLGTVSWRLLSWLLPFGGAIVGLAVYTWGVGSWLVAAWEGRAGTLASARVGSDAGEGDTDLEHAGWEPPLPPVG